MKKILAILLALITVTSCCLLASCEDEDVAKTTLHVSFRSGIYDLYDKDVEVAPSNAEKGPSLLDLLYTIIDDLKVPVTLDADNNVEKVGLFYATDYEGITYYWTFTVNGKEVGGESGEIYLKAGDKVAYNFVQMTVDEEEKIHIDDYDCNSGVFEDKLYKQNK
ncbi:MAG: hypothetical protein IJD10_04435 [Clostridia bacterium]|nr:hypothetical protein [Clostridia bacterium]